MIDSRPPRPLRFIIEPWQQKLYDLLTPLIECAAGHRDTTPRKAAFITSPKGHGKTSTLGQLINWTLCYSNRQVHITATAADKDQAKILLDRQHAEARLNPWLFRQLKFRNYEVTGPTGRLKVIASDAPTASGQLDDIQILDEIVYWRNRELFDTLLAARHKRKDSILVVISNAGVQGTWQHDLWETAKISDHWVTYEVPGFSASWLDREAIEEDRRLLLPSVYARLHENRWIDLAEESRFVSREQVLCCVDESLAYRTEGC